MSIALSAVQEVPRPCFSSFSKLSQLLVEIRLSLETFQCCGVFDHLDQDNATAFSSQILQDPLLRFFLCVGVLHIYQLLLICDQVHAVSVCIRFRSFQAGAV